MGADTPTPSVRRAEVGDKPTLRALQRHLDETAPALLDAAIAGTLGECFVAVSDTDTPVGYLLAVDGNGGVADVTPVVDNSVSLWLDEPTTHVAELVVAPDSRRAGHASALLATVLAGQPAATVTLTVAERNDAARALYDRFGFELVQRLPDFFDDDVGLLLARRPRSE